MFFCKIGEKINGHEFHYSDSNNNGHDFLALKASGISEWSCSHANKVLYAGYPHIHLWGNINFARNFIRACDEFAKKRIDLLMVLAVSIYLRELDYDAFICHYSGLYFRPADWRPALAASSDLFNWKFDKLFRKLLRSIFGKKLAWLIGRRRCISNISACFFVLCSIFSIGFGRKKSIRGWLFAVESFMCYQIFATRCLREESMKVYTALKK